MFLGRLPPLATILYTSVISTGLLSASRNVIGVSVSANNMSSVASCFVTLVTCPSMEVAKQLSRGIVENRLAACVNIVPQVISVYQWEGKLEEDSESLMIIKTSQLQSDGLTKYIEKHHPYDVPEVITMEITDGSKNYLDWVTKSTQPSQD